MLSSHRKPSPPRRAAAASQRLGADLEMYKSQPRLYDLAFAFRDITAECKGLLAIAKRHGLKAPRRVVELACGPAHHLRELSRRGINCTGVDINREMLAYARRLAHRDRVKVDLRLGDMRRTLPVRGCDLVLCLFDSFAQCASEADAIATLRSAAKTLRRGGLLIVEFTHPADYFGEGRSRTMDEWTQRDGDGAVRARFTVTHLNPVEETFVASLHIKPLRSKARSGVRRPLAMRWTQRMWLPGGFRYVALASGDFEIVGWYGDFSPVVRFSLHADAWRMIAVLRKR